MTEVVIKSLRHKKANHVNEKNYRGTAKFSLL